MYFLSLFVFSFLFFCFLFSFLWQLGEFSAHAPCMFLFSSSRSLSLSVDFVHVYCSQDASSENVEGKCGSSLFKKTNVISDVMFGAEVTDPSLKNPW